MLIVKIVDQLFGKPGLRRKEGSCGVEEQRGEVLDHLRLRQFFRAVVVMPDVVVIILIVVVIFASHTYAQQVFLVLFTGVLNTFANVGRRGEKVERFLYEVHMYIHILCCRQKSGLSVFSFFLFVFFEHGCSFSTKKKKRCKQHRDLDSTWILSK